MTCEPSDAPTQRISVLTPIASPVCGGRDGLHDQVRPSPRRRGRCRSEMTTFHAITASSDCVVERHARAARAPVNAAPDGQRELGAEAAAQLARDRAGDEHHERARAAAAARRRWRRARSRSRSTRGASASCGMSRNEPNMPKPTKQRREVRHQHGRVEQRRDVDERLVGPALHGDPDGEHDERRRRSGRACCGAAPAPVVGARDREQRQRRGRRRAAAAPRTSMRPGVAHGRLGHPQPRRRARRATALIAPTQKIQW